jgi:hypothetical protein
VAIRKRSASSEKLDRCYSLTLEIYPNLFWMFRERLIWDVGRISGKYDRAISRAVSARVLENARSVSAEKKSSLIFYAALAMGAELFRAAMNCTAWVFRYDDPARVFTATEEVYSDVLCFARKKFESEVAAIPEQGPELEHALSLEWEKAKHLVADWSVQLRSPARPEKNTKGTSWQGPANALKSADLFRLGKRLVSFAAAEKYLKIDYRQRIRLVRNRSLQVERHGNDIKITKESLLSYASRKQRRSKSPAS